MKKPTEPIKPWPPSEYQYLIKENVRENIDMLYNEEYDQYYFPTITFKFLKEWAKDNNVIDLDSIKISLEEGSHEYNIVIEGKRHISQEMKDEADKQFKAALKEYNEIVLPKYEKDLNKYEEDLRAYYMYKHNKVGKK